MLSLFVLSKFITIPILTEWTTIDDIVNLDTALCNENQRKVLICWFQEFPKLFQLNLFPKSLCIPLSVYLLQWAKRRKLHLPSLVKRIVITDKLIEIFRYDDQNSKIVEYFRHVKYLRLQLTTAMGIKFFLVILELFSGVQELVYTKADTKIIEALAQHCWKLRSCNISESKTLLESGVISLLMNCPHLTELDVSCCKFMSSGFIQAVIIYGRQLTSLNVSTRRVQINIQDILKFNVMSNPRLVNFKYCGWTDLTLTSFCSYRENLQVLTLTDNKSITDDVIIKIGSLCANVTDVNLSYCHLITDDGIISLVTKLPKIVSLNLEDLLNITNMSLQHINQCCTCLKALHLHNNTRITSDGLYCLQTTLTKITLSWMVLTNKYLLDLATQCTDIIELNIRLNYNISSHTIIEITPFIKNVIKLNLSFCDKIGNSSMAAIGKHCKRLEFLDVKHCELISNDGVLSILSNCNYLACFEIVGCKLVTTNIVDRVNTVNSRSKRFM